MQEDLIEKIRITDEILQDLINDNDKWTKFNDELKHLETLFKEISSMFDAKMVGERPLEEKQQILEVKHSSSIPKISGENLPEIDRFSV